jgi:hypothetical protein
VIIPLKALATSDTNGLWTNYQGFNEVKDMFLDIKKHSGEKVFKYICIDNYCKWSSLLKLIFPNTEVKQDLSHVVQRFVTTLKKRNPIHRNMASDFGKVFRDPRDLGDNRKMPTPCKEVLLSNLQLFLDKWSSWQCDEVKLLNSERLATISNIRGHIQKGCLSEIPAGFSTSVNERLHKEMKKLLCKNRMGTQLAYAKLSRFFFKHNQNRAAYDSVISLSAKAHKEAFHGARNDIKQLYRSWLQTNSVKPNLLWMS